MYVLCKSVKIIKNNCQKENLGLKHVLNNTINFMLANLHYKKKLLILVFTFSITEVVNFKIHFHLLIILSF